MVWMACLTYKEDEIFALPFNETIEILLVGLLR